MRNHGKEVREYQKTRDHLIVRTSQITTEGVLFLLMVSDSRSGRLRRSTRLGAMLSGSLLIRA